MVYYIYILECVNHNFYIGYTTDIKRRYQEHLNGSKKCKYTRSFPPRRIAICWMLSLERSIVLKIEYLLKTLSKVEKQALVINPAMLSFILLAKGFEQNIIEQIQMYNELEPNKLV